MVETIAPVVYGSRRSYRIAAALHGLGASLSGALLGLALGVAGAVSGAPWGGVGYVIVAVVAALYFAREALGLPIPLPDLRRQVPEWWRTFFSPPVAALLYGIGLGVGFFTYLSYGTFVAVAAAAVASADPTTGAVLGGTFGLARSVAVTFAAARASTPERNAEAVDHLERWAGTLVRRANAAALLVVTVTAGAAVFGS